MKPKFYAGMTSYKWIEDCCKEGRLVDDDKYEIPRTGTIAVGVHRSSRRNEFSPDDDKILMDIVKKQIAAGAAVSGNNLYIGIAGRVALGSMWKLNIVSSPYCSILEKSMGQSFVKAARNCGDDGYCGKHGRTNEI
jgi:hypothetical protein